MATIDIVSTLFIFIIFGLMIFASVYALGINDLKKKWPDVRCSPMYMPLAGMVDVDPKENFNQCMAEIQESAMDVILAPIKGSISTLGTVGSGIMDATNSIRIDTDIIQNMIPDLGNIFSGIAGEVGVYFKKLIISISDLMQRILGIATIIMYYISGFGITGKSLWCGYIGATLRAMEYPLNGTKQKEAKCNVCRGGECPD